MYIYIYIYTLSDEDMWEAEKFVQKKKLILADELEKLRILGNTFHLNF